MTTLQKNPVNLINELLTKHQDQIARALPSHLDARRMQRIALTELGKNPALAKCEPISFFSAIIQAAQLGLEPGAALGHAYLIPYFNSKKGYSEAQLMIGYRGLIDLARRSGQIQSISARCVYESDKFSYAYGLDENLVHEPGKEPKGKITHVYAVAKFKDGGHQFEVMSLEDVEKVKNGLKKPNPVWASHFDEMARKTAVRRLFKYLPVSIELQDKVAQAIQISDSADQSEAPVTVLDIDPVPPENKANELEESLGV